jgi:hypothetical protein
MWLVRTEGGKLHRITCGVIRQIPELLKKAMEENGGDEKRELVLGNVTDRMFEIIVEFCESRLNDPSSKLKVAGIKRKPLEDGRTAHDPVVSESDKRLMAKINASTDGVFLTELTNVADSLGMDEFCHLLGFYIVLGIRGKQSGDMCEFFYGRDDVEGGL